MKNRLVKMKTGSTIGPVFLFYLKEELDLNIQKQQIMHVTLSSTYGDLNFKGTNDRGQSIQLSGNKEAMSPMESLLTAAAACSSIDIELILKKMRQDLKSIEVSVNGERRKDEVPAIFTKIHLHYILRGSIKEAKAKEAVSLSLEKYCSVTQSLSSDIDIQSSFEIQEA